MTRPSEICGVRSLPSIMTAPCRSSRSKLLGSASISALTRLALQRKLALDVQDGLLGVEQGAVEHDVALLEIEATHRALDRNAVVAGHIEHQRIEDLQAGEAHHQAADRAAAQRKRHVAVRRAHDLRQRAAVAGQRHAALDLALRGVEVARLAEEVLQLDVVGLEVGPHLRDRRCAHRCRVRPRSCRRPTPTA